MSYPPIAYVLVKEAMKKAETDVFWDVFLTLQIIIRREKKKSPFSYMNNSMNVYTTRDLKNIIEKTQEENDFHQF